jgi:twinkle protein
MTTFLNDGDIDFARYMAETDIQASVKPATAYLDDLLDSYLNPKPDYAVSPPWDLMAETFKFRQGEVTVWAGQNGSGKSMMTGQVALGLVKQGIKVCIASFEMKPMLTLNRMIRQFGGDNFMYSTEIDTEKMLSIYKRFERFTNDKLFIYDQQGMINPKKMIAVVKYCADKGIQHMMIDSLMKCVSGEDSYNEQKMFIDELTAVARDYNIHVHLVHHIRKLGNDETRPSKFDLRGSSSVADQVDNILIMWRNKKKEHDIEQGIEVDERTPDALLMCEKQRNGDHEKWYEFWYDKNSQQFLDRYAGALHDYDNRGRFTS